MDLLNWLEPDMMIQILRSLEDPADLVRVGAVSRSWRHFVIENGLCKQLCLRMFPQLCRVARVVELNQEDRMEVGSSSNWMEWESMVKDHRVYAFLAQCCTSFVSKNCIQEAICASSTDNYPEESIINTLEAGDVVARRASYWSSKGQKDRRVPETLVYKLVSDLCVITEISIQPFQAFFQPGLPIYSATAVRFRMGHPKSPDFKSDLMDESCHDDEFNWTYTSQEFQMAQEKRLQKFKLPEPVLCIGGYLQIELLGRVQRQEMDGLYYICVSHVQVMGHSLAPALGVEVLDSSGNFVLKHDLQADNSQPGLPENKPCSSSTVHLERRVRTLEQILEMLRGNQIEYVFADEDEDESDEEFVF